jgi:hypothetical protein
MANQTGVTASAAYVGIGDVLVIAGQSNASGRGTNSQSYSHATLKASLFGNDYTWRELADPTDSITNQGDAISKETSQAGGSLWPLLATSFLADQGVPVAFIPCAKGGTRIADWLPGVNHQDRATLYGSMVYRALQSGCKAVLWWQGEGDAQDGTSQATYNSRLDSLANEIQADLGVKLMPCKLQNITAAGETGINAAIAEAWGDNANVLTGPDLSDIATDDDVHLQTDAKLLDAAGRWWAALQTAFY